MSDDKTETFDEKSYKINEWCSSVRSYIKDSGTSYLDLEYASLTDDEFQLLHKVLEQTQFRSINLRKNQLRTGIKDLPKILITNGTKKLNISINNFRKNNLVDFFTSLKETQLDDLNISDLYLVIDEKDAERIVSGLSQSSITRFCYERNSFQPEALPVFFQGLQNTSISYLNLNRCDLENDGIILLASNLKNTSITHLNLNYNNMDSSAFKILCSNLKDSKIEKLDVGHNKIDDEGIEVLGDILPRTKLTELNLSNNEIIKGADILSKSLPKSQIKELNLGFNAIGENDTFTFPECLKDTLIDTLILSHCNLGDEYGQKLVKHLQATIITKLDLSGNILGTDCALILAEFLKKTEIVDINLSQNDLRDSGIVVLGECLKFTKIKYIDLSNNFKHPVADDAFVSFLQSTHGTSLLSLKINFNELMSFGSEAISPHLKNTPFSHFDISSNWIEEGVQFIAKYLKFTSLTNLNLANNKIEDIGAEALAKGLKNTQVIDLDLTANLIGSPGAKALALALKDSNVLFLKLNENSIEDDGLEALAEHLTDTSVTILETEANSGEKNVIIENSLWKNRRIVSILITTFKYFMPVDKAASSNFHPKIDNANINTFLDNCLLLFKTVIERPSFIGHLLQETDISLTKDQIKAFMVDEFPRRLSLFIASNVEAEVAQHVTFLLKAEELGLNKIVENLLLNRPMYVIDKEQEILHPFVYKLLHKHHQPLFNLNIEPQGKEKLINYFTKHSDIEGASDVIDILKSIK